MKKDMIFTGAGTALVTPFTPAGEIAWEELEKLVDSSWRAASTLSSPAAPPVRPPL